MKILLIVLTSFLLLSCSKIDTSIESNNDSLTDHTNNESSRTGDITCSSAISNILEIEQKFLSHFNENDIIYQRGGFYNNQISINFTNQTITVGNNYFSSNYYSRLISDDYRDWINHDLKFSEEDEAIRQKMRRIYGESTKKIDIINKTITTSAVPLIDNSEFYGDHSRDNPAEPEKVESFESFDDLRVRDEYEFFIDLNFKLDSLGCSLNNLESSIFETYNSQIILDENYLNNTSLIRDPIEINQGVGIENMIQENPNYHELKHWQDYKAIDPFKTLEDGSRINVGFIIVIYNNDWINENPFNYLENYYKYRLYYNDSGFSSTLNPFFLQHYFRDFWFTYALENAPKVYFYNTANDKSKKFSLPAYEAGNNGPSNSITFDARSLEEFKGDHNAVFEYKPIDDGVEFIGYPWIPYYNGREMMIWYSKYLNTTTLSSDIWNEYWKVYNFEWQKKMGARELYIEKYGPH